MPKISKECIEAVRMHASILEIVEPYTQLKRAGSQYRGLSPFNHEKTPSFYVHPEKNVFKCYSSGHAGDVLTFVQLKENLPFQTAVEWLAERFRIPMQYEEGGQEVCELKAVLAIHDYAAYCYHQNFLSQTPEGEAARAYWLEERGLSKASAEALQVGVAKPHDRGELMDLLIKKGFPKAAIEASGIFYLRDGVSDVRRLKPRFRGRLMVPIRDVQGRVVAFTGRVLSITPDEDPTKEAKYVNSPETILFKKSQMVFGLEHARLHLGPEKPIMLVEGQLDAIRCWEVGLHGAVAPQGTSVTAQQLHLLRRYGEAMDVVMDGDRAGEQAALRLLPMAIEAGLNLRFITLPDGEDPDSFLKVKGLAGWEEWVKGNRVSAVAFAAKILAPEGRRSSPHVKEAALRFLLEAHQKAPSRTLIESSLQEAADLLSVSRYSIDHEFRKIRVDPIVKKNEDPAKEALTSYESVLLIGVLHDLSIAQALSQLLMPDWIDTQRLEGRLLDRFTAALKEGLWKNRHSADDLLEDEEERNYLYSLIAQNELEPSQLWQACKESLHGLFVKYFTEIRDELTRQMAHADPTDEAHLIHLQKQRIEIRRILQNPPKLPIPKDF
jgi:DNA primase